MKTIYLTIAEPCHENWNTMTPDQKGRFCAACKKTVVDFSGMTDQQLVAYFTKGKENRCGRFYPDQLQRVIAVPPKPVPLLRPFLPLAISALTILFEACTPENKVMGEPRMKEHSPVVESLSVPEKMVVSVIPVAGDTTQPKTKKNDIQVITKKNKTLHPSFVPVDTMRLPEIDTINKPGQSLDSTQKPLVQPRKETFIMGRIVLTPSPSKAEKDK